MDLNEAAVFVKVVEAGGFSAAARQMGLPTSTVSQRVARLEKRLDVTLLQRTTRQVKLTDVGELFYRHATVGLDHLNEAEAAVTVTTEAPCGLLRITAPTDFGDALLAAVIRRVRRAYPGIEIELFLTDRLVDLVGEGLDVAIRTGELEDSSLVARAFGWACWALFASPDYPQDAPCLERPEDLAGHECVQFASLRREEWQLSDSTRRLAVPMAGDRQRLQRGARDDARRQRHRAAAELRLPRGGGRRAPGAGAAPVARPGRPDPPRLPVAAVRATQTACVHRRRFRQAGALAGSLRQVAVTRRQRSRLFRHSAWWPPGLPSP